jgi:hypothetical protein
MDDNSNWEPPKEYILAYAKDLGFNADYDPPKLLNIFKNYLLKPIPSNYIRAFYKDNFHLLYINVNTSQIIFEMGFEEEIKEEYLKAKKELDEIKIHNEFLLKLKYNKEPNNYYIIEDIEFWEPSNECILEYAKKIGFDINDPPQLLDNIKKFLLNTPSIYKIVISKIDNQIMYLNKEKNYEICFTCEYEEETKKQLTILKKELKEKKIENNENENKMIKIDRVILLDKYKNKYYNYKNILKEKLVKEKINFEKKYNTKYLFKQMKEKNKLQKNFGILKIKYIKKCLKMEFKQKLYNYKRELNKKLMNHLEEIEEERNKRINDLKFIIEKLNNDIEHQKNKIKKK